MGIGTKEHAELMAMFEKEFKHRRLDREAKELWPQGAVYQDGHVNELFLAYRRGCSYGRTAERMSA